MHQQPVPMPHLTPGVFRYCSRRNPYCQRKEMQRPAACGGLRCRFLQAHECIHSATQAVRCFHVAEQFAAAIGLQEVGAVRVGVFCIDYRGSAIAASYMPATFSAG